MKKTIMILAVLLLFGTTTAFCGRISVTSQL